MTGPLPHIGQVVLYQTDERGGLRYTLPAIITGTHDTHPDRDSVGQLGMLAIQHSLPTNPVPIPNTYEFGAVHLHVFTPGPAGAYTEHSVPHDNTEHPAPRTWRHHP